MENQNQQSYNPSQTYPQSAPGYQNQQTQVVINNVTPRQLKSKWAALALCFFFGLIGAHKFYEGKTGMGILYLFTGGLFGIGAIIDFIILLFKPSHYEV